MNLRSIACNVSIVALSLILWPSSSGGEPLGSLEEEIDEEETRTTTTFAQRGGNGVQEQVVTGTFRFSRTVNGEQTASGRQRDPRNGWNVSGCYCNGGQESCSCNGNPSRIQLFLRNNGIPLPRLRGNRIQQQQQQQQQQYQTEVTNFNPDQEQQTGNLMIGDGCFCNASGCHGEVCQSLNGCVCNNTGQCWGSSCGARINNIPINAAPQFGQQFQVGQVQSQFGTSFAPVFNPARLVNPNNGATMASTFLRQQTAGQQQTGGPGRGVLGTVTSGGGGVNGAIAGAIGGCTCNRLGCTGAGCSQMNGCVCVGNSCWGSQCNRPATLGQPITALAQQCGPEGCGGGAGGPVPGPGMPFPGGFFPGGGLPLGPGGQIIPVIKGYPVEKVIGVNGLQNGMMGQHSRGRIVAVPLNGRGRGRGRGRGKGRGRGRGRRRRPGGSQMRNMQGIRQKGNFARQRLRNNIALQSMNMLPEMAQSPGITNGLINGQIPVGGRPMGQMIDASGQYASGITIPGQQQLNDGTEDDVEEQEQEAVRRRRKNRKQTGAESEGAKVASTIQEKFSKLFNKIKQRNDPEVEEQLEEARSWAEKWDRNDDWGWDPLQLVLNATHDL